MDVNKLGLGQRIAAAAGVLLFIDLFLDWYSANTDQFDLSASGWEVFSYTDLLCALTAIVAVALALQAMGVVRLPVKLSQILLPLAALTTLIVLYRLINQPSDNDAINNEFGAYLGFLLVAAVTYGALRAQDESEAVAPRTTAGSAAPTPPPPTGTHADPPASAPPGTTPGATTPPPATPPADDPPPPPPASPTP